jgi:serine phosphatase RsbU (regulator of sigma subunit)
MPMRDIRRGCFRDNAGITPLEATGLPLGLFTHTMQSAASCHLMPGSALLVVSRGIVEADYIHAGNLDADHQAPEYAAEFGLDGVKQSFQHATALKASELCLTILQAARKFTPTTPTHNDLKTLVLVRTALDDCFAV